ncbi:MAG TPA: PKD domain-containing protein [Bacteroidia bacterium]|nr:PKD domain-containing protein [Bacteroidia bacterium]
MFTATIVSLYFKNFYDKVKSFTSISIIASILFSVSPSLSQTLVSNFSTQLVNSGLTEVEGICFDSTGRGYAWEKAGIVWVYDTNGVKITPALLNISAEVGNWGDHGLNGFALDPNFRTNGFFYLFYTVDRHYLMNFGTGNYNANTNEYQNATIARVTRYTANASTNFTTIVSGSRQILIGENKKKGIPILHLSHSGGQLVFGRDGSLLVSTGDGASFQIYDTGDTTLHGYTYWEQALSDTIIREKENVGAFRSQMIDCLNGKILRINPATGDGLPSNPYYDAADPRAAKSRVWDLGLRNPFRMTIRPGTGSTDITAGAPGVLYIGDVGMEAFEDLDVSTGPGLNFGWPLFEGLTPHTIYTSYNTVNKDAPNPLYGGACTSQYFKFKELLIQANLAPSFPNPCNAGQQIPANIPHFVHARPVIDYDHTQVLARTGIYSGNNAAVISLSNTLSPIKGFDFGGNCSVAGAWYPGTKYPLEFQGSYFHNDFIGGWIHNLEFLPNNTADSVKVFASGMGNIVSLQYNPKDQWLYYIKYPSDIYRIIYSTSVNNPPVAVASQDVIYGAKPLVVHFTGNNSTDPENQPLTYSWNFGDGSALSTAANPTHTFNPATNNPVAFTVKLKVTDNIGQKDSTELKVYVNDTPPQVDIISFDDGDLFTMSHNTNLPLQANVSDAESADHFLSYSWQTFLHHNSHEHPEAADTNRITSTVISPVGCDGNTYYYRIALTVTDPIGLSTTVQGTIYPSCDPPDPDFSANVTTGCPGLQVSFTDATTKFPDSWLWTFTGGTPSTSTLQNPVVVYSTSGTRNVTLATTNARGTNTITKTAFIVVNSKPTAAITPAGTDTICAQPLLLTATAGANRIYQWQKGGTDIAGATGSAYNTVTAGTYKVRVTNTITGCSTVSAAKKIVYRTVNATATPQGPVTFCAGDSVKISANSGPYTYQWKKGATNISGATKKNYTAKNSGNYKVQVTDAFSCTKLSGTVTVTVNCKLGESAGKLFSVDINPNPVHNQAVITISMPEKGIININVYDALGRKINSLAENFLSDEGDHEYSLDVSSFTPGFYFVKVFDGNQEKTLKLIVDKGN